MIGVEPAKHRDFRAWSNARAPIIDPLMSASERVRAEAAGIELDAYFSKVIEQRRIDPRDDIVSALVAAEEVGDRVSAQEVLNMLRLLLIAGNETTANLFGNTVIALHAHPGALEALRSAGVSRGSFEELLRYDSPVQADLRGVVRDMDFGPVRMRAGDGMVLLLGSANRDPAVFPIPDRLDFERSNSKAHVSFGRGIHHCLGAQLVGLEVTVALEARSSGVGVVSSFALRLCAIVAALCGRRGTTRGLRCPPVPRARCGPYPVVDTCGSRPRQQPGGECGESLGETASDDTCRAVDRRADAATRACRRPWQDTAGQPDPRNRPQKTQ